MASYAVTQTDRQTDGPAVPRGADHGVNFLAARRAHGCAACGAVDAGAGERELRCPPPLSLMWCRRATNKITNNNPSGPANPVRS